MEAEFESCKVFSCIFVLLSEGASGTELDELVEGARLAFLASSAAKEERTDVMICWECMDAARRSATSAAVAKAAFFLDGRSTDEGPFACCLAASDEEGVFVEVTVGSLLSRLRMLAVSPIIP